VNRVFSLPDFYLVLVVVVLDVVKINWALSYTADRNRILSHYLWQRCTIAARDRGQKIDRKINI
jgi:hypothetical protein